MNNLTHNIIGWCAGLAIGMTIGVSLYNIALGIGVGAVSYTHLTLPTTFGV